MALYRCSGEREREKTASNVSTNSDSYTVTEDGIYCIAIAGCDYASSGHWEAPSGSISSTGTQLLAPQATGGAGWGSYSHPYYSSSLLMIAVYKCKAGDKINSSASAGYISFIVKIV